MVRDVQTELRIDGREADIRVEQTAPAPLSIYNDGNETVDLELPAGGLKIDARTIDGRLTVDDALAKRGVKVETSGSEGGESGSTREEQHVEAVVAGGGPLITIRAQRGDISLRSKYQLTRLAPACNLHAFSARHPCSLLPHQSLKLLSMA